MQKSNNVFVNKFAELCLCGNNEEFRRLKNAFPELWEEYRKVTEKELILYKKSKLVESKS